MITTFRRPRSTRPRGHILAGALAASLALAACGGDDTAEQDRDADATTSAPTIDDTSDESSETVEAPPATTTEATAADGAVATTAPSEPDDGTIQSDDYVPGAEVFRVVNSTADPVDIYVRTTGLLKGYEIHPGLGPGEVTEYFAPPQDGSVIITTAGAGDPTCVTGCDHFIADISAWDDTGDTFTVLLHDADGEPEAYDFWEETGANTTSANAMVAADPSVGQFVAIAVDVMEADFGMRLGLADIDGCVEPVNLNGGTLVGGNQAPAYAYDGDSAEVVLYDNQDQTCTGEPVGGPFTVTGGPGTRTFLFLTGTPGALDAIIVPFGSDLGVDVDDGPADAGDAGAGDDPAALLADQLQTELGLARADALCLAGHIAADVGDLLVVENGELVEPPGTPENQERVLTAFEDGAVTCDIDTGG